MSIVITDTSAAIGSGPRWSPLPSLGDSLYAGYLIGTDYHGAAAFTGTPLSDLSGYGRDLTLHGAAPGAKSMACSPAAWLEAPFALMDAAGDQGVTIITIAASSTAGGFVEAGVLNTSSGSARGLAVVAGGSDIEVIGYNLPGGPQANIDSPSPRAAATFEMHAVTGSADGMLAYRRRADFGAAETSASPGVVSVTSTAHLRIGRSIDDGPLAGSGSIAAVMIASRALGVGDLDETYAQMKALLGSFSLTI